MDYFEENGNSINIKDGVDAVKYFSTVSEKSKRVNHFFLFHLKEGITSLESNGEGSKLMLENLTVATNADMEALIQRRTIAKLSKKLKSNKFTENDPVNEMNSSSNTNDYRKSLSSGKRPSTVESTRSSNVSDEDIVEPNVTERTETQGNEKRTKKIPRDVYIVTPTSIILIPNDIEKLGQAWDISNLDDV
jgi:hypothetical protein